MRAITIVLALFLATSISANCTSLDTLEDARSCIAEYAQNNLGEGEMEHSIGVSNEIPAYDAVIALMRELKVPIELTNSHYVAVVMQHYDDDPIHYYSLEKVDGEVKIVELFRFYMVDAEYDFPVNLKDPLIFSLYLMDIDGWHYDYFDDLAYQN